MFGAAAMLAMLSTASCAGTTSGTLVYDYPATYVDTVPVDMGYYPRAYYHGHYAYRVHDRWYYPSGRRWVVFREEPHELQRYRIYNPHRFEAAQPRYRPTPEFGVPDRRYDRHYRAPVVVPQEPRYRAPQAMPPPSRPDYQAPRVAPHEPRLQQAPSRAPPAPRYHAPQPQAPHQGQRHYRPR
jgi:hypothetical protein